MQKLIIRRDPYDNVYFLVFFAFAFFVVVGLISESFVTSSESFSLASSSETSSIISSICSTESVTSCEGRKEALKFSKRRVPHICFFKIGCWPSSKFLRDFTKILSPVKRYRVLRCIISIFLKGRP